MEEAEGEVPEDEEEYEPASYPWSKDRMMWSLLQFCAEMQRTTADFVQSVADQTAADHNQKVDTETFRSEAAKEIETIFQEPETTDG